MAAPIPLDAPVTTATLPFSLLMGDDFESKYWTGIGGNKLLTSIVRLLCSYAVSNELQRQSFKMDDRTRRQGSLCRTSSSAAGDGRGRRAHWRLPTTQHKSGWHWRGKAECQSQARERSFLAHARYRFEPTGSLQRKSAVYGLNGQRALFVID